jgi:hypothetical protein
MIHLNNKNNSCVRTATPTIFTLAIIMVATSSMAAPPAAATTTTATMLQPPVTVTIILNAAYFYNNNVLLQLLRQDPVFRNFVDILDNCVSQVAPDGSGYNATDINNLPTPHIPCMLMMLEVYRKWCGLEEYNEDNAAL